MADRLATRLAVAAAFAAIYLFWGGTFLAIRYAVADIPPLLTIAVRCMGGAALIYLWLIWRGGLEPASGKQCSWPPGGVAVMALSLATGEIAGWSVQQVTARGAASLFFLVVAGTVLGFGAYTWLLRVSTPAAVGTYAFVNPVVALALAWAVGDEPFSVRTIAAAMTVLGAVMLIRKDWSSRRPADHSLTRSMSTSPMRALARFRVLL